MFIASGPTLLMLLLAWFAVVAFSIVALAYFVFSAKMRREQFEKRNPGLTSSKSFLQKQLAARALQTIGIVIFILVLVLLSTNWVMLYRRSESNLTASLTNARYWDRNTVIEQYHEIRIAPHLLAAAYSSPGVAGDYATIGSPFLVRVKLEDDRMKINRCDRRALHNLLRSVAVSFQTVDLTLSKPAIDDASDCYITWTWIAMPREAGASINLATIAVRGQTGEALHFSKVVTVTVQPGERSSALASSIPSVVVALITLIGVIVTALANRRSRRTAQRLNPMLSLRLTGARPPSTRRPRSKSSVRTQTSCRANPAERSPSAPKRGCRRARASGSSAAARAAL